MKKDNKAYFMHIADALQRIERYVDKMEYTDFMNNDLVQAGVIREFEIIGEASKKISKDIKNKYSDVPWRKMAGMRDKLIHEYFGVDLDAVWETIQNDLPVLIERIDKIIWDEYPT